MGNHRKFLKSEKAKVKLKGNKLKGPQNVTKTDFKVRKIVIPEQLKNVVQLESGERKKHSINDCLARLKNSSSAEVISNLKDIILYQSEDFQKNLEAIIKIIANLSLSIEKNDRKECFKILDIVCSQTSEFNLRPFFPILVTYLKCAMTHIKPAIQEDSLLMLDLLLKHAPKLVASEKDIILTPYLDLVSKMRTENNPERTLSLQMGNKITNIKWRKSVMERLIVFLKCINREIKELESEDDDESKQPFNEIILKEKDEFLGNPFRNLPSISNQLTLASLENFKNSTTFKENESFESNMKYIHMIMPLMFETWMETKPADNTTNPSLSSISQDNALMLKLIMDIIMELFSMIEKHNNLKQQFLKKYQDSFERQFMTKFPYTQNDSSKKSFESGGLKCVYQNLSIAIMYLNFSMKNQQRFQSYREKVFVFAEECINSWRMKDQDFNNLMKKFIRTLFSSEFRKVFSSDSKKIFDELIKKCNVDQSTYDPKLALVCEIIEGSKDAKQDSLYDNLIIQMVEVLAKREFVPMSLIKTISLIARRGNKTLHEALEKNAVEIVKNLQTKIRISGSLSDDEKWKMEIVNLIYWVEDSEILQKISKNMKNDKFSTQINEIVSMKLN